MLSLGRLHTSNAIRSKNGSWIDEQRESHGNYQLAGDQPLSRPEARGPSRQHPYADARGAGERILRQLATIAQFSSHRNGFRFACCQKTAFDRMASAARNERRMGRPLGTRCIRFLFGREALVPPKADSTPIFARRRSKPVVCGVFMTATARDVRRRLRLRESGAAQCGCRLSLIGVV
jgi:hypothetical protein